MLTRDIRLIRWLCNEAGGFFMANPDPDLRKPIGESVIAETQCMMRDFTELLDAVTESVDEDSHIDEAEAIEIRQRWEDLKAMAERFVVACEKGHYRLKKKA